MKTNDINYRSQPFFSKYSQIETAIFKWIIFKGTKITLINKTEHFKNMPFLTKSRGLNLIITK